MLEKRLFIRGFIVYFIVSFLFLSLISYWRWHLLKYGAVELIGINMIVKQIDASDMLQLNLYISILLAVLSSLIDVFLVERFFRKLNFTLSFIVAILVQLALVGFIMYRSSLYFARYIAKDALVEQYGFWEIPDFPFLALFLLLIISASHFLLEIDQRLGRGNLWRYISGKFYKPRSEERIFMFLDLNDSTQTAENIGHLKFSQLLQDCFSDLRVVARFYGEVYQYVGDEVVLTWKKDRGLHKLRYVRAFYAFKDKLKEKEEYYREEYGLLPVFKAGVHMGECTVSEMGNLKREISYLGDTLNTASRIEGKCRELKAELLISSYLMEHSTFHATYHLEAKENTDLRGKEQRSTLYKVERV